MFYLSGFADEIHESIDEQIRVLKELNIHSIEVRGVDGRNISTLSLEETQALADKLTNNGISVSAIGSPLGKISLNDPFEPHLALFDHMMKQAQILKTTVYNYKELAKQYKELASMGYSKMLPLIALGQSQSSILANAYFETQVLDLVSLFIPPLTSNTMNSDALKTARGGDSDSKKKNPGEEKQAGRKEKADDEKSDKTIANRESMN